MRGQPDSQGVDQIYENFKQATENAWSYDELLKRLAPQPITGVVAEFERRTGTLIRNQRSAREHYELGVAIEKLISDFDQVAKNQNLPALSEIEQGRLTDLVRKDPAARNTLAEQTAQLLNADPRSLRTRHDTAALRQAARDGSLTPISELAKLRQQSQALGEVAGLKNALGPFADLVRPWGPEVAEQLLVGIQQSPEMVQILEELSQPAPQVSQEPGFLVELRQKKPNFTFKDIEKAINKPLPEPPGPQPDAPRQPRNHYKPKVDPETGEMSTAWRVFEKKRAKYFVKKKAWDLESAKYREAQRRLTDYLHFLEHNAPTFAAMVRRRVFARTFCYYLTGLHPELIKSPISSRDSATIPEVLLGEFDRYFARLQGMLKTVEVPKDKSPEDTKAFERISSFLARATTFDRRAEPADMIWRMFYGVHSVSDLGGPSPSEAVRQFLQTLQAKTDAWDQEYEFGAPPKPSKR